ncbi:MAG: hypothetical protein JNJ57_19585 [Saprospiraceae bacterium]|nr:hypothetical protein [Saprospiraceae bacterium]
MKTLLAFTIATLYGLFLRFVFAFYGSIMEIISISMVVAAPLAIGYLTVTLMGLKKVTNHAAAFFWPWLTCLMLLIVTIMLAVEGAICWVIIFPFFAVGAGFGGLIAYGVLRAREQRSKEENNDVIDDFDRKDGLQVSLILMFPIFLGFLEQDRLLAPAEYRITRQMIVPAEIPAVWSAITSSTSLNPEENQSFFTSFFGLPRHQRTELDTLAVGGRRTAYYERGLYFEETITQLDTHRTMRVSIKADPGNVPPTVLDEHIVIGGRHFKALEDTYVLTPRTDGTCLLELSGRISINTPFNWYSGLWARWVLSDLFDDQLRQIGRRATNR